MKNFDQTTQIKRTKTQKDNFFQRTKEQRKSLSNCFKKVCIWLLSYEKKDGKTCRCQSSFFSIMSIQLTLIGMPRMCVWEFQKIVSFLKKKSSKNKPE